MPVNPSPAQAAASRANGAASRGPVTDAGKARSARNGTSHGLRGGDFCLLPGEDGEELALLEHAVAADWHPRDAFERHWTLRVPGTERPGGRKGAIGQPHDDTERPMLGPGAERDLGHGARRQHLAPRHIARQQVPTSGRTT